MDDETVRARVREQLEQAQQSGFARRHGWDFDVDGLTVYIKMRRATDPAKEYVLRLTFDDFPKRAPSYKFVDPKTRKPNDDAWPPGTRHEADGTGGICTPGTREFHEIIHKGDAQYPWDADRYSVLGALHMTQRIAEKG
jgi:hypothetical protein